jgi:hypothetical protein
VLRLHGSSIKFSTNSVLVDVCEEVANCDGEEGIDEQLGLRARGTIDTLFTTSIGLQRRKNTHTQI